MAEIDFCDYNDFDMDLKVAKIKDRNIIVVGLTGSGKSSIIKSLCNLSDNVPDVKMTIKSVTKNLNLHENNLITNPKNPTDQYSVNLFDTVGIGDADVDVPEILRQIINYIPKNLAKIHRIVFCFKMDRLRAKMSEALNLMYQFFKLVGAKPENFVVVLTFCDILRDDTIRAFWSELKKEQTIEMMSEIDTVTYTSFPNLEESDTHEELVKYLKNKTKISKFRVFQKVIEAKCEPFYPYETITRMEQINFDKMCDILVKYRPKSALWRFITGRSDREEIIKALQKLRTEVTSDDVSNAKERITNWDMIF